MEGSDGPNRLTYFVVCSDDMGRARKLPDVTEDQLITARQIKKYMTGDLSAPVSAYPPFAGTEANFLRAQIALISSDTFVAPTGFFALEESDEGLKTVKSKLGDDVEPEEKPECPGFDALASLETWTHYELPISKMGRMQAPPMGEDGETPDPYYGEAEELREATQGLDADMDGESPNWKVQQCPSAGGPGSVSVVHSLKWPGAVAVYPCGSPRFVNCYVGYAVPNSTTTYTPPALPALQSEFAQKFEEQPDVVEAPAAPVEEEEDE
jgi:radial spoke head protein 4A